MKTTLWITLWSTVSFAAPSRISEVTVFQDRASVTRVLTAKLPHGASSVVFSGLTPNLMVSSLKARISDKKRVTLLGVRHEDAFRLSSNSEAEAWRKKRVKLTEERSRLFSQTIALRKEKLNLNHLTQHYERSFAYNLHQNTWSRGQFRELMAFLSKQSADSNSRWYSLFLRFNELEKEISFVDSKVLELASDSETKTGTVQVDVTSEGPAQVEIALQYLVSNTGWSPSYDLRISPNENDATLHQSALVWQNTGEDWEKVKLTLNNVNSELSPKVPFITRYTLSIRDVEKVKTQIKSKNDDVESLETGGAGNDSGKSLARSFAIAGLQTVRQGQSSTKVSVAEISTPFKDHLELVAAQFPHVFRKVELKNAFGWDLAAGTLNVYLGRAFLQQTHLSPVPKGKIFAVNAGIDHNLKVERWFEAKDSKSGLLAKKRHYERLFKTALQNFGREAKAIRVMEQIPVSELEEVKVSTEGSTAGFIRDEAHPGWVYWDFTVAPHKKEQLALNLAVTAPEDFQFSW